MAQFRGTLQGNDGEASRLGTKKSSLVVTCNGWNIGIRARIDYNERLDKDVVSVEITEGSKTGLVVIDLGSFVKDDDGKIKTMRPTI